VEIIKQVTERTGISETQAQQAIDGLSASFRSNFPPPVADTIGGLLSGGGATPTGNTASTRGGINMDDALGALGGLLGGAQSGSGQGAGLDDLLGGLLGGATGGGDQAGFGLDDIMNMLGSSGGLNLDSLVESVVGNAGVSPDIATTIVQTVLQFLGEHLPEPLGSALTSILGGQSGSVGGDDGFGIDDIARGLGGLLGG